MHLIEHPSWFKPERFYSFASWIAAIYEENLWANYIYYQGQKEKGSKISNNVSYLFEMKENQTEILESVSNIKLHSLANTWLCSTQEQKMELTDRLKNVLVGEENYRKFKPVE